MNNTDIHYCRGVDVIGSIEIQCTKEVEQGEEYCPRHDPNIKEKEKIAMHHAKQLANLIARRDACEKACEGFDDPMELRKQRDEAVQLLRHIALDFLGDENGFPRSIAVAMDFIEEMDKGEQA